jgi:hypothetical protein
MPVPEILGTLTEVFAALVGFAGVVVAFGRSSLPRQARQFRIKALLTASSVGLGASILPSILVNFEIPIWTASALLFLTIMIVNFAWAIRGLLTMVRSGQAPQIPFWLISIGTVAVMIGLAVASWRGGEAVVGFYVLAVGWHVLLGMYHFIRLILAVDSLADGELE